MIPNRGIDARRGARKHRRPSLCQSPRELLRRPPGPPCEPMGAFLHPDCAGHPAAQTRGPTVKVDHRMSLKGGHAMRTCDLAPLYRATVGFDRLFSMLDQVSGFESAAPSYPPYNIERTGENDYRITVAVAGFTESELSIEVKEGALTIRGEKQVKDGENAGQVLYQGIAARAFERRFQLADHVEVKGAALENGLLHVDLVRAIPEAMKPRQIRIGTGTGSAKVIDAQTAKAA